MFEIAFSFQGRLKRLPYFLGAVALGVAYGFGLAVILVGGVAAAAQHAWLVLVLLCLAILPMAIAVLWCSLSLHVRRIRDIGWDPAIVVTCWVLANIADKLILVRVAPALAAPAIWHATYLGLLANSVLSLAILFWPSKDDDRDVYEAASRVFDSEIAYAPPPSLSAPTAPRLVRADGTVAFGRRGLR